MRFLHFKARTLELAAYSARNHINDVGFRNALYMIDIGQNDIADSFAKTPDHSTQYKQKNTHNILQLRKTKENSVNLQKSNSKARSSPKTPNATSGSLTH
ncbi:hypothetical protein K1719_039733 [Acacia pycnantha]|nr:hypothetical protein K1719_039733 [Acacia pycnantha]